MAVAMYACKCLNIKLESDKVEDNIDIGKLQLTATEQRDTFFSEKLLLCPVNDVKIQVVQPALIDQRFVGTWTIKSCLSCGQTTHAILQDKNRPHVCILNGSIQTTADHINTLKQSTNYSPIFNLLMPDVSTDIEMKENVDTNNLVISKKEPWPSAHQVISSLNKLMNARLQSQQEAVEESIRQYREQKYAEYEAYMERAKRDYKILSRIVSKALIPEDKSNVGLGNGPPSPQLPPLQRRRLSSIKDAKKHTHNFPKNNRSVPHEEDSLDAEDLFDLEGMDARDDINSDQDYYDSDDGSDDEGIQIARPRGGGDEIARSLPMNIARFPNERSNTRELDHDEYEEPQDIAASIQALARSVHGDAFDLPRPRFSTKI